MAPLQRSPLFENIHVTTEGDYSGFVSKDQAPIGSQFPAKDYTNMLNVKFDWGNARIYTTKLDNNIYSGSNQHVHILSNGLWQFSMGLAKDPEKPHGDRIQKTFFIDVIPRVRAEDIGYPFNLNRQQFTEAAGKEFGQIFLNIQKLFIEASHAIDAENFGEMRNLSLDTTTNKITSSAPFALKPAVPLKSAVTGISMGDNVDVKNGQLVVKGRTIPEITPKQAAEFKIDVSKLRIPQDKIPKRDILHDNTFVSPTGAPLTDTSQRISMTQYGVQKFGDRFYTYTFVIGRLLDEIRNVVKKYPGYSGSGK